MECTALDYKADCQTNALEDGQVNVEIASTSSAIPLVSIINMHALSVVCRILPETLE